jgi:hypothetical protein
MTTRHFAVLGLGVVLGIGGLGLAWGQAAASEPRTSDRAAQNTGQTPCVVVWRAGGLPLRGKDSQPNTGLEIAVWDDGTILYSPSRERLGQQLVVGKVPAEDVPAMLAAIRAAGFWDDRRGDVVPDSSFTTIIVNEGGKRVSRQWHEYLLPGFGSSLGDAQYRDFVRSWKRTRGAIESLAPVEIQRLEEVGGDKPGANPGFRGYNIAKPPDTPWSR